MTATDERQTLRQTLLGWEPARTGTRVENRRSHTRYVKQDDGRWRSESTGVNHNPSEQGWRVDDFFVLPEQPVQAATEEATEEAEQFLTLGERLSYAQFQALPIGAGITTLHGYRAGHLPDFIKTEPHHWGNNPDNGRTYPEADWTSDGTRDAYVLSRLPTATQDEIVAAPPGAVLRFHHEEWPLGEAWRKIEPDRWDRVHPVAETVESRPNSNMSTWARVTLPHWVWEHNPALGQQVFPYVGAHIDRREQLDQLPVGTRIEHTALHQTCTKTEPNRWVDAEGSHHSDSYFQLGGSNVIIELPARLAVDARILDRDTLDGLPVGTVIRSSTNRRYTKTESLMWRTEAGSNRPAGNFNPVSTHYFLVSYPDATPPLTDGQPLTFEQLLALPVGAGMRRSSGRTYVKQDDGRWRRDDGSHYAPGTFQTGCMTGSVFYLATPPAAPMVVTWEQFQAFPAGAVIRARGSGPTYTKQDDGRWSSGGTTFTEVEFRTTVLDGRYVLVDGGTPTEVQAVINEARDVINRLVNDHGQWHDVRDAAFAKLGIAPVELEVGQSLPSAAVERLPHGCVVRAEYDTEWWVWVGNERNQPVLVAASREADRRNLWQRSNPHRAVRVLHSEPQQVQARAWRTREEFLSELYSIHDEEQTKNHWCSAVIYALEQAGLTRPPDEPQVPAVGEVCGRREYVRLNLLPAGSVIRGTGNSRSYTRAAQGWVRADDGLVHASLDDAGGSFEVRFVNE